MTYISAIGPKELISISFSPSGILSRTDLPVPNLLSLTRMRVTLALASPLSAVFLPPRQHTHGQVLSPVLQIPFLTLRTSSNLWL